ncbi:hypothetical protein Gotur_010130 [Gossypium turneri]
MGGEGYKKKAREMANARNQTCQMKRLAVGPMTTFEYSEWWVKSVDTIFLIKRGRLEKKGVATNLF